MAKTDEENGVKVFKLRRRRFFKLVGGSPVDPVVPQDPPVMQFNATANSQLLAALEDF